MVTSTDKTQSPQEQSSQGQSLKDQSPRTQAFLKANDENLQELATFVDFAGEKFTPCFVSVNFPDDRATIIEALRHHPACEDVQFVVIEVSDPKLRFLRDDLVERLPKIERDPDKKLVLLLTGLEASIGMVGDYPPMLVDLNYVRDGFKTAVPHPMIIFLPDESLRRLGEFAPDFWAWRMGVVRFESVPDAVKSKMYQAVKRGAPTWLTAEEKADYKALDDRARRDLLPRLLMEYESGSLSQDEDYKGFKSELMAELGISLYNADSLEVAKDILWKSLESESFEQSTIARPKARRYLGIIERRQENYEKALELLNQSIGEFEGLKKSQHADVKERLAKVIASRGETYQLMERYPEAVADYTRAIELDPEFNEAIAHRGYTYRLMERYPEAVADYTRVIELDPENNWTIAHRGYTYRLMERYPEAVADYTCAIELDSEYEWAITQRGETYQLMERYPEAVTDYTRAIELAPKNKEAPIHLGEVRSLTGKYIQALQNFNRSLELDTNSNWTLYFRSLTYRAIHQAENAAADIEQAVKLAQQDYEANPLDHRNTFNLAIYHLTAGNVDQAKHLYQNALEKEPPIERIKAAIHDLEDLLTVLPNFPNAQDLRSHLRSSLSKKAEHTD